MGFYFRKSVRFGPFRVNFSKSGVGLSAGIPGLRLGSGPRGNYIHAGAHGFYYRSSLLARKNRADRRASELAPPTVQADSELPDNTLGDVTTIETAAAEMLRGSSWESLVEEMNNNHRKRESWRFVLALCLAAALVAWINSVGVLVIGLWGVLTIVLVLLAYRWDLRRKLTVLHYRLDPNAEKIFEVIAGAGLKMGQSARLWHLTQKAKVLDHKYHAGASSSVSRSNSSVSSRLPPFVACNVSPVAISFTKTTLYFLPDRIFVYQGSSVGAVSYSELKTSVEQIKFIEDESPPSDATVVGHTWRFVNKKGGPDKRFQNNRQLPVCLYSELDLQSESGLHETLQLSKTGLAESFAAALLAIAEMRA